MIVVTQLLTTLRTRRLMTCPFTTFCTRFCPSKRTALDFLLETLLRGDLERLSALPNEALVELESDSSWFNDQLTIPFSSEWQI